MSGHRDDRAAIDANNPFESCKHNDENRGRLPPCLVRRPACGKVTPENIGAGARIARSTRTRNHKKVVRNVNSSRRRELDRQTPFFLIEDKENSHAPVSCPPSFCCAGCGKRHGMGSACPDGPTRCERPQHVSRRLPDPIGIRQAKRPPFQSREAIPLMRKPRRRPRR